MRHYLIKYALLLIFMFYLVGIGVKGFYCVYIFYHAINEKIHNNQTKLHFHHVYYV